jgi:hypothetical protein
MHKDLFPAFWETPELTSINRLPMGSTHLPCPDRDSARTGGSDRVLDLNGKWEFRLLENPRLLTPEHLQVPLTETMDIPANWTLHRQDDRPHYTNVQMPFQNNPPQVPDHNPTGVYAKTFQLPADWQNRRTILHVGAAESVLLAYLNGHFVGMSKDSRLPAEFDLSQHLREGDNRLVLVCIRWSDASYVEDQDHWWMAGIYRRVYLKSVPQETIEDAFVEALTDLPRAGLRFTIMEGFDKLEWLGLGPHETYPDRKAGARLGRFQSTVTDQFFPYIVPQETGHHTETRWFSLTNQAGKGLFIESIGQPFGFSVLHFTPEDLTAAYHPHKLCPRKDITVLIDAAHRGLGTRSCGPDTLEKYRLSNKTYSLQLKLRAIP